ncbi:DUF2523 domain-containing protein [Wielerella bovis]|uniref:DUF2523 family protein n=1 Tax=Wielerella bovis TaxID=2917790 RepID=UPI002018FB91|nr:DUF2523 family protein [Wielerella bovis]ULJ69024.1 DUF2523 domain-containing protein [Wielerella bovis]
MKGSIGLLLTSVFTTLAGKIMAALGLSIITYTGVTALQQQMISRISSGLDDIPSASLQIFYLAGGGVALNWLMSAISFSLGFKAVSKLGTVFSNK